MKIKAFIFLIITFSSSYAVAQWRLISTARFAFNSVYFLDLPGPPLIGFTGGYSQLLRTTDGGNSWKTIDSAFQGGTNITVDSSGLIVDFAFKDSLTGWLDRKSTRLNSSHL